MRVQVASRGRVDSEQWLQAIRRGKIAAISMDDDAFYYTMEPLIQMMGGDTLGTGLMSLYQNLYQGRGTKRSFQNLDRLGFVADYTKVGHDKAGQVSYFNPGAIIGSELLRANPVEWVRQVALPQLAKHGITDPKAIEDTLGGIVSNKSSAGLLAMIVKFMPQILRDAERNKHAAGLQETHAATMDAPQGRLQQLAVQRENLYLRLGEALLPAFTKLLQVITPVVEALGRFAEKHQLMIGIIGGTVAILAGFTTAVGALLIPLGMLLVSTKTLTVAFNWLTRRAGAAGVAGAAGGLPGAAGKLGKAAGLARGALGVAGAGEAGWMIGSLANDTLIEGTRAGDVIGSSVANFVGIFSQEARDALASEARFNRQTAATDQKLAEINARIVAKGKGANAAQTPAWLTGQAAQPQQIGANISNGLSNGLAAQQPMLYGQSSGMAQGVMDAFQNKLEMHSPSRVFMRFGQYIGDGAALGMLQSHPAVKRAALALAATAGMAGGLAPAAPAFARPPAAAAAAPMLGGGTYSIVINAQPGMDPQAIAQAVRRELDNRERAQRGRVLSQLSDME